MNLPRGVLSEESAKKLKKRLWDGELTQGEIADEFFVSQPTVSRIYRGVDWPSIEWPDGTTGEIPLHRHLSRRKVRKKQHVLHSTEHTDVTDLAALVADRVAAEITEEEETSIRDVVRNTGEEP